MERRLASWPLFLAGLTLAAWPAAQSVSPANFGNAEASTSATGPLGQNSTTGWRHIQVHDDLNGSPRTFTSLSFRRDRTASLGYNRYTLQVTLRMSDAATTSGTIDSTFDNNHGTNVLTVVNNRQITFPSTAPGSAPAPFVYEIPFDVPFRYSGSGSLAWEIRVSSSAGMLTSYSFDAASSSSTSPPMGVIAYGQGCRHSSRLRNMSLTGSSSMNWNTGVGSLFLDGSELPESAPISVILGFSNLFLGGAPLPFALPGSAAATSGPCYVYHDARLAFQLTTSGSSARFTLPIPATPGLQGVHIFGQFVALDPFAGHPLGVTLSNVVDHHYVEPYGLAPVSQVQANNLFATTGQVRQNYGYVIQLR